MKQDFETVVREEMAWLSAYVRRKLSHGAWEDLVQEIFIKAFRAYDDYEETGKRRGWLARIADNTMKNYFTRQAPMPTLSLDLPDEDGDTLFYLAKDMETPEERMLEQEQIRQILQIVSRLSKTQRTVFSLRYMDGYSVSDISKRLGIPEGTVKSQSYYAIRNIRKELGISEQTRRNKMTCKEYYDVMLIHALGLLTGERKKTAEEHLKTCKACADMSIALKNLIPKMQFGEDTTFSHFAILFPNEHLWLTGCRFYFPDYEKIKRYMDEHDGALPRGTINSGSDDCFELYNIYDEKGNALDCEVYRTKGHIDRVPKTLPYFAKNLWIYETFYMDWHGFDYKESKEAPGLFYGSMTNNLGVDAKSMLFHAVPKEAENIRIKRGNGVHDCSTYKFAYVDRYVADDDRIRLDYSFQIRET